MVNWKKWFLEENEDEIFEEQERKTSLKTKKNKAREAIEEEDFDIEFSSKEEQSDFYEEDYASKQEKKSRENNKEKREGYQEEVEEINLDDYNVSNDFDLEFYDEEIENTDTDIKKENGFLGKIRGLFSTRNSNFEEDYDVYDEGSEERNDEAEDYKTYLERQKHQEKQGVSKKLDEEVTYEDESYSEEKPQGFFSRIKERLFSVSDDEIEKEELDILLDDLEFDETVEETVQKVKEDVKVSDDKKDEKEEFEVEFDEEFDREFEEDFEEESDDNFDGEFEEVDLEEYEEVEGEKEDTTNLENALKQLGIEDTQIQDVDIFGDKSERRTHPTLAAVRTKRLKQDHKMDELGKDVTLERDATDLKKDVADTYKVKDIVIEDEKIRKNKNKDAREEFTENFNKLQRKEDKIEKDNPLRKKDNNLDKLFDEIEIKEKESHEKEIRELEIHKVDKDEERRGKLRYTTVNDVLEGAEDLFEDDIDRLSKKVVGEHFEEKEQATKEVEELRKDLYDDKKNKNDLEKTALDELMEEENLDVELKKEEKTLQEIEELNQNLEKLQKEKKTSIEEQEEVVVDLVKEAARIEDIEIEAYDELKEVKKDRLEGYSDYHLGEDEIMELEEQNYLEENTDNVNIDSLLREVSPKNKLEKLDNDVDKFVDEKVEPQEVAARRIAESIPEEAEENSEEEQQGIEYTEKLYTNDVTDYFEKAENNAENIGEYKVIDRGYRPVSKEKIENNQKILEAIFEKYSTASRAKKTTSVTKVMAQTNTLTPVQRSVGKFKPTPVYSSVYGSGERKDINRSGNRTVGISTTGLSINKPAISERKRATKKQEEAKQGKNIASAPKQKKTKESKISQNTTEANVNIYKEIASQEETVWNIGSAKRVPKNKIKKSKE